jgi:hypothetical protein
MQGGGRLTPGRLRREEGNGIRRLLTRKNTQCWLVKKKHSLKQFQKYIITCRSKNVFLMTYHLREDKQGGAYFDAVPWMNVLGLVSNIRA